MDPPVVHESHGELPVVARGTTVLHPPGALDRIAEFFGIRPSHIHTLTVSHEVPTLYGAICKYAAQLGRAAEDSAVHLTISPSEAYECNISTLEEFAESMSNGSDPDMAPDRPGVRRKLSYQLGLSDAVVFWPPPARLERSVGGDINAGKAVSSTTWPKERSQLVYIVNYSFGIYKKRFRDTLLIAAVDERRVRQFSQGVLDWNMKESAKDKYPLLRFKASDCESGWSSEGHNRTRHPESIILQPGQMEDIMNDIAEFLDPATRKWYTAHGLPHRRSFLFYGPPGTGKTSTISAIASKFRLTCCFLSITDSNFSNQKLADAFSELPSQALVVVEDIDAMFNGRESEMSKGLSFSGLLNAFDGVLSAEGVITIMTTNHPEKLDAALTRGGRVDRRFYFGKPRNAEVRCMFKSFYPDCDDDLAKRFVQAVNDRSPDERAMSIATLQEVFIRFRKVSAQEFVERVPSFFDERLRLASGRTEYDDASVGKLYM